MRIKALMICGLFAGTALLADSTVVKDTVAIVDTTVAIDTMKPIDRVLQQITEEGRRLELFKIFLLKRLEAAEVDSTAIDSGRVALGRSDRTRDKDLTQ